MVFSADIKLGRWDEALADCNAVLKVEPQNTKGASQRGGVGEGGWGGGGGERGVE